MKTELYAYAMSQKSKKNSDIPNLCIMIVLSVFLVPMLLSNIYIALILCLLYIVSYVCVKKEKNIYEKFLLNIGLFLLLLGIECSLLVIAQHKITKSLILTTCVFVVVYEIIFAIKIKLKIYSQKTKEKKTQFNVISLICGGTGVYCGRVLARNLERTNSKLWLVIFFSAGLLMGSVTFLQKLLVSKLIKK